MQDLAWASAHSIARAIRDGELTSRDHVQAVLERIERLNGPLNAVVTLDPERALREADAADEACSRVARSRGEPLGPLHGVCMTVKDSFQTKGMRTTSGAPELANHVPEIDAVPVARLREAGAVIVGKTNLPIYAGDCQSYNQVFGQTNNPWKLERTPGGSSGGSAAALAAGLTPLELGSDIGGSIRGPASTCGVAGHKPSFGIVPAQGQIPGPPGTLTQADIAVAGPMARDVDDLALGLDVLAGPDSWHGVAYRLELPPARHASLRDYRIAVWLDEPTAPLDTDVRNLLGEAAKELESAGARVDHAARPDFEFAYATDVFADLLTLAMCASYSRDELERLAEQARGGDPRAVAAARPAQRHRAWLSANERRLQLRQKWHTFFADWDAVLLPTLPTAAIPHDHSPMDTRTILVNGEPRPYFDQARWVGLTGVAYLPATVVPVGLTREGLPVGIQIAGPFLEDRTTLDLARRLCETTGGFQRPPGYP